MTGGSIAASSRIPTARRRLPTPWKLRVRESIVINTQPNARDGQRGRKGAILRCGDRDRPFVPVAVQRERRRVVGQLHGGKRPDGDARLHAEGLSYSGRLYRCIIVDAERQLTTSEAPLTVKAVLRITANPQDVTVPAGEKVTFSVKATGSGLTYRWEYSRDGGETWKESTAKQASSISMTAKASLGWRLLPLRPGQTPRAGAVSDPAITITAASTHNSNTRATRKPLFAGSRNRVVLSMGAE